MINLLPPEMKSQISAARTNRLLLRYNVLLLAALGFMLIAIAIVYLYLVNAKATAEATVAENRAKASDYAAVESEANAFKQNLANAKQILDGDITYTKVVLQIASLLPSGVVLDNVSLDSSSFGSPTVLSARAKDYSTVLTLKSTLQNSSLFSNVSIQSISSGGDGEYPLSVMLSVTIKKDAAQ